MGTVKNNNYSNNKGDLKMKNELFSELDNMEDIKAFAEYQDDPVVFCWKRFNEESILNKCEKLSYEIDKSRNKSGNN